MCSPFPNSWRARCLFSSYSRNRKSLAPEILWIP
jgi:hypothetical protein